MKLRYKVVNIVPQAITRSVAVKDDKGNITGTQQESVTLVTVQLVPVANADSTDNAAAFDSDGVGWITLQPMTQAAATPFQVGQVYDLEFTLVT